MQDESPHHTNTRLRTIVGLTVLGLTAALVLYIVVTSNNAQPVSTPAPDINNGNVQEYNSSGTRNTPNPNGQSPEPDPSGATPNSSGNPLVDQ